MSLLLLLYVFSSSEHQHLCGNPRLLLFTDLGIILLQAKDQRAERHAKRAVDRFCLRRRIISQNFDSDIGIAHRNDTSLLHAHDSHVNLSLTEATGRVNHCITLEPVGHCSHGWEGETNVRGNARHDKVLAPCSLNRIDDALLVPCVNRIVVTITGTLSASMARV